MARPLARRLDGSRRIHLDDIDPADTQGIEKDEGLKRLEKLGRELSELENLLIYAGTNGYLDRVATGDVGTYETELYRFFDARHLNVMKTLAEKKQIDDALKSDVNAALKEFGEQFLARKAA